ncbi:MAG: 4Fe-4S dicluster domain-containing protein [Bacillota bacterium]|nr:4Fe-4S dicluster domain-containing protein [Bacillota bacterium]
MKKIPVLFIHKEDCCGCSACMAICPRQAIRMEEDEEGFFYPFLDEQKCVSCFLCEKVCPQKDSE